MRTIIEDVNDDVDFIDMVTNKSPKSFSDEKLQEMINRYKTDNMEAKFGLSFIVHSFNKFQERGNFYVVIFDSKSKKVLFSERMSGEARGFGFRNYWGKTVFNIIKDIKKRRYKKWKNMY